jgi:hypothetical protein
MFLLAAAAALASAQAPSTAPASSAQATATIRVVRAVRLKLDAAVNPGAPDAHDAVLRLSDGTVQPAKLIEFQ